MDYEADQTPTGAQAGESESDRRSRELSEMSNAMVRLYKEQFGRGPTKARSAYAGRTSSFARSRTASRRRSRH